MGALGGDVIAELPFILMHPKPVEEPPPKTTALSAASNRSTNNSQNENDSQIRNLIQLE